ncbi:2-amino-4-hydroxy-6-hydroxymethyldihydropteridine diphosphokinase [Desulfohalovibrio reitneri]|uniref:2-amino-4-hydroxy-6- hydroxymethyldihydropteridine diphosphokinase n=1 Tax=Desulfohalovibrio reitneri TaxID=1307759 RepID=UPI0004A6C719|nr:2-amino-4-hydroxy-6-hydroxymethyldihydropteridine diphosphokinase [Desulfohalovibrio reitneri]
MESVTAYLGLGSNIGDPEANLHRARELLASAPGVVLVNASSIYRTQPQLVRDQPWFANQVLRVETKLSSLDLLTLAKSVERVMGREEGRRFGPRLIDVDLLLYRQDVIATPELEVPHPRLHERAFVLIPLVEIAPDILLPDGESAAALLARLDFQRQGRRIYQT